MKPTDLTHLYSWDNRRPLLQEGLFAVPRYFAEHKRMEEWDQLLDPSRPLAVEFCSGNGEWILEKARLHPETLWIAIEKDFGRVRKIWSKRGNQGINNLLIVYGFAEEFCKFYLPDQSLSEIYVNFPDPWPKSRHAKHRLIQREFVELLGQKTKAGATFTLVTDDQVYRDQMVEEVGAVGEWRGEGYRRWSPGYGGSYFSRLWESKGKDIWEMKYEYCRV